MPRFLRRLPPQLAVALYSLIPLSPLLRARMTCSDDGIFHIYKAVGLEAAVRLGHLLPRWSPHMAHGYGYPLFNFYAPLASYMMIGWHALGLIYPVALHITLGLAILLSGLVMFALVREWWGEAAGVGAGVVYLTAPYLAFDALFRGALAETVAWVFPPLVLWALDRALRRGSPRWAAGAALAFAALIYTHNTTALVVAPLAAGFVALLAWERRSWRVAGLGAAALAAGLAVSARFWLPALAERDFVQTERLLVPPIFTYYTNFITPADLLAPPAATNAALINPSPPKALGLVTALLAAVGLASAVFRRRERARILFFGAALIVYGFMTIEPSRPLWDVLPLIQFVQFPWRLLMPAALCASVLAGAAIEWGMRNAECGINRHSALPYGRRIPQSLITGNWLLATVIALAITLANLSWWYPRYCGDFAEQDVATMLDYEDATFTVGTSAKAEFLPDTAIFFPDDDSLAEALRSGEEPSRLTGAPAGAQLEIVGADPLDFRARVDAPVGFVATYRQFFYPGWRVSVDSKAVPVHVAAETGLIQFDVPVGEHDVRVWFGTTPIRALAGGISVLGLTIVAAALLSGQETKDQRLPATASHPSSSILRQSPISNLQSPIGWLILVAPLALFAAKLTFIDRTDNPLHHTAADPAQLGTPVALALDNGMDTLAYQVQPRSVENGAAFDALLYLTPRETIERVYRPKFVLVDARGRTWNVNPDEALPPRWHREPPDTRFWLAGDFAEFARRQELLPGAPPGIYELYGVVFDLETLAPARVLDANGAPGPDRIPMGSVEVVRSARPVDLAALDRQYAAEAPLGAGLALVGHNVDRAEAQPGEQVLLTLFLRAETGAPASATITFGLDETDFEVTVEPTPGYPTRAWRAGDVWRTQHLLRLPADLPAGDHHWTVRVPNGDAVQLASLHVNVPDRTFSPVPMRSTSGLTFGDEIALVGFNLPKRAAAGDTVEVTLLWHALDFVAADLRAFVHLAAADGALVAQSDGVPADWARPTPGWLPGEYIVDARTLPLRADLPPGEYDVYVGLVDAATGERVPPAGGDAQANGRALIATVEIDSP